MSCTLARGRERGWDPSPGVHRPGVLGCAARRLCRHMFRYRLASAGRPSATTGRRHHAVLDRSGAGPTSSFHLSLSAGFDGEQLPISNASRSFSDMVISLP